MLTDFNDLTFQVLTVKRCGHNEGYFKVAARPYAALSLRLSGTGKFRLNGRQYISNAGDVLYIPAGLSYEVGYSVNSTNEIIVIHLLNCNYTEPEFIKVENRAAAETHFFRILEAWENDDSVHLVKSHIYAALDMIHKEMLSLPENKNLSRLKKYLEEHFQEPELDIDEVCREFYISRSTLQRLFSRNLGVSPWQYLSKLRMSNALKLLSDGEATVKEAALASGFSDEKYFSCVFKRAYGISPSYLRGNSKV